MQKECEKIKHAYTEAKMDDRLEEAMQLRAMMKELEPKLLTQSVLDEWKEIEDIPVDQKYISIVNELRASGASETVSFCFLSLVNWATESFYSF